MATFSEEPEIQRLIALVTTRVQSYMLNFDGSHDFNHITRVVGLAHQIYHEILKNEPNTKLHLGTITLGALLHDVGDRKYLKEGENQLSLVQDILLELGAHEDLAAKVQAICLGVSHSGEVKNPELNAICLELNPELGVVQDADRLDALGAVGVGRIFTYGGAKTNRDMEASIALCDAKLLDLEDMMKTGPGRRMAKEKTARLRVFKAWFDEEAKVKVVGESLLAPSFQCLPSS